MKTSSIVCLLVGLFVFANSQPSYFVPFGTSNGDSLLAPNDDSFTGAIPFSFRYFGTDRTILYVNNNGLITFDAPTSTFTPSGLAGAVHPTIAVFWADVDTRGGSFPVSYRSTTNAALLASQSAFVQSVLNAPGFTATHLFVATWNQVGYYLQHQDKTDTFQVVLVGDDIGNSFVIFNYGTLQWTTGDASGGSGGLGGVPAFAGFAAADGIPSHVAQLPGSGTHGALQFQSTTNIGHVGQWAFRVNDGVQLTSLTLTLAADATIQCGAAVPSISSDSPVVQGNCAAGVGAAQLISSVTLAGNCGGSVNRTYSVSDNCGNVATASRVILAIDTIPPVIYSSTNACVFPPNGLTACFPVNALVNSTDICTVPVISHAGCTPSTGCSFDSFNNRFCVQAILGNTYNIPFTSTDSCGNQVGATSTISVSSQSNECLSTTCDSSITGVSPSVATFSTIDAYGYEYKPEYRAAVTITVQEALLQNWRLEIHFPGGDQLVRYGGYYNVYTDGQFKCETAANSVAVVSPNSWANAVTQGNIITVEFVATNNGRLTSAEIAANTHSLSSLLKFAKAIRNHQ